MEKIDNAEHCVFCGNTIPEGNQVCIVCGRGKPKMMTNEEALNKLDETVIGNLELKIILTKALEKQIPKKPTIYGYREGREINTISYTCPVCNKHISRENYCKYCGQALDWSDTE